MKLFSADQIRKWDSHTIQHEPISSIDLMERASNTIVEWILNRFQKSEKILILVGPGNNGGDGLAVGRILFENEYNIQYYCFEDIQKSNDNNSNYLKSKSLKIKFLDDIKECDSSIIIDAVFGSGLSREITGKIKEVLLKVNALNAIKIAIDCPSGIHADKGPLSNIVFKAHHTLTLQLPKISFFYKESIDFIGVIHKLNIGLIKNFLIDEKTSFNLIDHPMSKMPVRKKFSHKGTFGHSLIIAGEMGKMGASYLSAKASLRSGSGLTTILLPKKTEEIIQSSLPEAMTVSYLEKDLWTDLINLKKYSAIAIGPGIGNHSTRKRQLMDFLDFIDQPVVLDADALNIIAENNNFELIPQGSILTPHPGEFKRLFGEYSSTEESIEIQRSYSIKNQIIIIHKLAHTIISDTNGNIFINNTGNPGMATAGSGDVLTGVITGLLAQGFSAIESSIKAVYHHGIAGDHCKKIKSEINMIASDLINYLFVD